MPSTDTLNSTFGTFSDKWAEVSLTIERQKPELEKPRERPIIDLKSAYLANPLFLSSLVFA